MVLLKFKGNKDHGLLEIGKKPSSANIFCAWTGGRIWGSVWKEIDIEYIIKKR